jgi:hypothetical protein
LTRPPYRKTVLAMAYLGTSALGRPCPSYLAPSIPLKHLSRLLCPGQRGAVAQTENRHRRPLASADQPFSYLGCKIGHLQLKLTCTSRPPFLKIGEETSTIHTSGYCGCPAQGGRKASGRAGDIAQRPRRCSTDRRQPNHFRVPCAFLGLDQALPDRRDWSRVGGEQIGPPAPQPRCAQPRSLKFRVGIHPRPFPFRPVASDLSRAERKGLIWRRFIESHRIFDKHVDRMQSQQKILPTSKAFRGSANLQRGKSRCFRSE